MYKWSYLKHLVGRNWSFMVWRIRRFGWRIRPWPLSSWFIIQSWSEFFPILMIHLMIFGWHEFDMRLKNDRWIISPQPVFGQGRLGNPLFGIDLCWQGWKTTSDVLKQQCQRFQQGRAWPKLHFGNAHRSQSCHKCIHSCLTRQAVLNGIGTHIGLSIYIYIRLFSGFKMYKVQIIAYRLYWVLSGSWQR